MAVIFYLSIKEKNFHFELVGGGGGGTLRCEIYTADSHTSSNSINGLLLFLV